MVLARRLALALAVVAAGVLVAVALAAPQARSQTAPTTPEATAPVPTAPQEIDPGAVPPVGTTPSSTAPVLVSTVPAGVDADDDGDDGRPAAPTQTVTAPPAPSPPPASAPSAAPAPAPAATVPRTPPRPRTTPARRPSTTPTTPTPTTATTPPVTTPQPPPAQTVQAVAEGRPRLRDLPPYDPQDHPVSTIEKTAAALVLVQVVGGGLGLAAGAAVAAKVTGGAPAGDREANVARVELWEKAERLEDVGPGDRSASWRWPGTPTVDRLSLAVPAALAARAPLVARLLADGSYLRAMLGSLWTVLPLAGIALGVAGAVDVSGDAMPPALTLTLALVVLGALDATAGLLGLTAFVAGVVVSGGLDGAPALRTLVALAGLWVVIPLVAGYFRPLRRVAGAGPGETFDRLADAVIVAAIAAWAVHEVAEGLSSLALRELPVAEHAGALAVAVLLAMLGRVALESLAAHTFPARLRAVEQPLPEASERRLLVGAVVRALVLGFVIAAAVGWTWQLYVVTAMTMTAFVLKVLEPRFTRREALARWIPDKMIALALLVLVAAGLQQLITADDPGTGTIATAFVLLAIPGFVIGVLGSVVGKMKPAMTWTVRLAGAAILTLAIVQVVEPFVAA